MYWESFKIVLQSVNQLLQACYRYHRIHDLPRQQSLLVNIFCTCKFIAMDHFSTFCKPKIKHTHIYNLVQATPTEFTVCVMKKSKSERLNNKITIACRQNIQAVYTVNRFERMITFYPFLSFFLIYKLNQFKIRRIEQK